ncbi:MAG: cyclase family protein [Tenericutes bacterium]|jgi:arylformamidase|nr:cyclase family protein [Mycoplasmatota bacterium]
MIYDISMRIHEDIQVYKNKEVKKPVFKNASNHNNSSAYETKLDMNLHTGTHVDYPFHMIPEGKTSDAEILDKLMGSCKVLDFTNCEDSITKADLMKHDILENDFLLFKTKNSLSDEFLFDFVYLDREGAKYLKELKIRGVGTDGLGIERNQEDHLTHKILLGEDIVIIEGLRLKDIEPKSYEMICLPLKIQGVEASPARVILKD